MSGYYTSDTVRVFSDSDSFFDQLTVDIENAHTSVFIQCMSFEADRIGNKLIKLLAGKPAVERTLLIDSYSKFVVNDVFLAGPGGLFNKNNALKERVALNKLLDKARNAGITIHFTNPMGFLMHKYPVRNHKKMMLIDQEISYLGGMNFTEHNFRWTDLMVRHSEPKINRVLRQSFLCDLKEVDVSPVHHIDEHNTLFFLNGLKTKEAYGKLLKSVSSAKKIVAISPYISYPLLDAISKVSNHTIILPKQNNKGWINYIHKLKRYKKINFMHAGGEMVHMKLIIIDDQTAIYGSGNFDTISYFFEKEVVLKRTDPKLVQQLAEVTFSLISK